MNKVQSFLAAAVIMVLGLMLATPQAYAAEKQLRVVGSWSNLTMFRNLEKPFWTEVVPEATDGKIQASMTSLSQISQGGAAVLRQMDMGIFDVVHTVADYVVSDSPELSGLDMPVLAPDLEQAREVAEAFRPIMDKYLQQNFNVKLLSIVPYPAQVLFSRDEIKGLDDLKGKKIRGSGWSTSEFLSAAGAIGVTLSFDEVPQSLQRGVVDGAVTGSLSGYSAGWGEVTDYVYPLPIGGWDYVIGCISMKTWDSFTAEQQEELQELIRKELEEPGWNVTERETQEGIACLTGGECPHGQSNDLEEVPVTESDIQKAQSLLVQKVLPAWADKVGPETTKEWNETIGEVVGLKAE
ncbi:MAG: TRAP transporter substrate-binding protein [Desulfovermiculus sp.]|nr:TRAP transporter substrate-binding protein [Desulfovermiculus sp.]